jgi:AmmeMemoRadiSam system protein B/AmmeMemoRadiSam system protein A
MNIVMKIILLILFGVVAGIPIYTASEDIGNSKPANIRPAAVSDSFYPSDPQKLKLAINQFLQDSPKITNTKPIALIVPHAGYIYSGQICADAYRQALGHTYDVIALLGTNHTSGNFQGVSLGDYTAFRTPLGDIQVEEPVLSALLAENKSCNRNRAVHSNEHSIEVQIPFIQLLFPNARIVPIIIHPPDPDLCIRFGESLAKALKNRRALIIISSDLSHYPNHEDANKIDHETLEAIATLDVQKFAALTKRLNIPNLSTRACGEAAILAGITAAKALGAASAEIVGYANSGDVPIGDISRTVGYGAVVLTAEKGFHRTAIPDRSAPPAQASPLTSLDKNALLSYARKTIVQYLTTQTVPLARNFPDRLDLPQGAFVTLKKSGELRGCIGNMRGDAALARTVGAMALQAAFNDPRFAPVQTKEMAAIEIEISVLTPMRSVTAADEIVVERDGVLMTKGEASAVFLPQVATENKWSRTEMLDMLCQKASLSAGCWRKGAKFQIFQADVFNENEHK